MTNETKTVSLADENAVKDVLVKTVFDLWEIVNNLTRLRPSRQDRYRVTIFGSARAQSGCVAYDEIKRIAEALAAMDCDIVTGGGPGLMQAANEGASSIDTHSQSVGIRVELPFEQNVNSFVKQSFEHKTFFTRLHHFVLTSDAFVVAPGGLGTVLELMMIWQLLQVHHLERVPLILVGKMWEPFVQWGKDYLLTTDPPLASAEDFKIPELVATADEAIQLLQNYHQEWISSHKS